MQASKQQRVDILGTPIDNMTMKETIEMIANAIENNNRLSHTVVNAGKIVLMHKDPMLKESVVTADIINAIASFVLRMGPSIIRSLVNLAQAACPVYVQSRGYRPVPYPVIKALSF